MKQNLVLMLTFLILLVGFFASTTTYTGSFLRESITSRYTGSIEDPDVYRIRSGGLISRYGALSYASESRIRKIVENTPDFWDNNKGDVDYDGDRDVNDCRTIALKYSTLAHHNSPRIQNRFNQPQVSFDPRMDFNEDSVLTYADQRICYVLLARNQDSERANQVGRWNCAQIGDTTCIQNRVHHCMLDSESGLPNWVIEKPTRDVDLAHITCLPPKNDEPARYRASKPTTTLYK